MTLKPYRGTLEELRFGVYDLEWTPETMQRRLAGVRDVKGYRSYRGQGCVTAMLRDMFTSDNRGMTWFAHAGGLADIQFVLDDFIKRNNSAYRIRGYWSGSALIICRVSQGKNSWTFADSFWLFRDSLDKIGKSIGLHKGGDEYRCDNFPECGHEDEHGKVTCIFYAPDGILREYNERDCEILFKAIERFQGEVLELGGKMKLTIAATAMQLFRSAFLGETVPTSKTLNRIAREAYIASRVEVYARECGSARYYDVNSSFPHSMSCPLPGYYLGASRSYHEGDTALVDATLDVPDCYLPPLPVRLGDDRIYFPTGKFRRLMTGDDFDYAVSRGARVLGVHEVHRFETFTDLAEYVSVVYKLRKEETDDFRRLVYKYLLNALYGKFGEDIYKAELVINPHSRPECSGTERCALVCTCVDVYAPGIYRVEKEQEVAHAHVPIAAAITSKSRILLSRYLEDASIDGRIFYSDTDSIVTTSFLKTSPELGMLKDEEPEGIERGTFLSAKLYKIKPKNGKVKVRSKGFRKLTEAEFDALASGDPVKIRRMVRIKENFSSGCFSPREEEFEKHALSHLNIAQLVALGVDPGRFQKPKREFLSSGDTRPWHMSELLPESPITE